ncbi:MAG: NAD(P)H-dependent oxidoreductase [Salinispira sp.]
MPAYVQPAYVLAVLAHPDEESFCAALQQTFTSELDRSAELPLQQISVNLYHEAFNPVMDLPELRRHLPIDSPASSYLEKLQSCRELILFFPDWWGAEPAILKGFFDRLFRQGIAYDREDSSGWEKGGSRGLLGNCALTLWICSDSSGRQLEIGREQYYRRFHVLADYCGIPHINVHICSPLRGSPLKKRRAWLQECRESARNIIQKYI